MITSSSSPCAPSKTVFDDNQVVVSRRWGSTEIDL